MESGEEDLDNIFEENPDNAETSEHLENAKPAGERVAPTRRVVKNPRLKFNAERLCGERGIPILMDHFKSVKFKGKGHEKEDLAKLLGNLEHWTHRLFPSMKFEDCLRQIEKLGKKRPVQTCLRKIRLDMPILSSDFVKDDEEDDVLRNDDPEPPVLDAFDRLIKESQDISNSNTSFAENVENNCIFSSASVSETSGQVLGSSFGSSLTEEQKERMQRNRLLAAERRKAKLTALQINTSDSQSVGDNMSSSQSISVENDDVMELPVSTSSFQNNTLNNTNCLNKDNDSCNEERNENSSIINNNSENLGLDDLIDLVDDDEIAQDKNVNTEISESTDEICRKSNLNKENISVGAVISLEETVPINNSNSSSGINVNSTVNVVVNENVDPNIGCESTGEILGLESMMDLVEGDNSILKTVPSFSASH